MRVRALALIMSFCVILFGLAGSAYGLILAAIPLSTALANDFIVYAKVEKVLPEKPAFILNVAEDLKGKAPFRRLAITMNLSPDAKKLQHDSLLLKRLAPDLPVILFVKARGKSRTTFGFTNGTWFQINGVQTGGPEEISWNLSSAEPYLRKTFAGTTSELKAIVIDSLTGKIKPPDINEKEKPGFGPEVEQKSSQAPGRIGGRFAVIPTLGIGAPLAILALLFPAVFGGVLVLFRQWMGFITVLSLNSTLLLLQMWLGPMFLRGTWWNSSESLWLAMTLVTLGGTLWAWRRQLNALWEGSPEAPARTEHMVLQILTACTVLSTAFLWYFTPGGFQDLGVALTGVIAVGLFAGTIYRVSREFSNPPAPMTTEGIILGFMAIASFLYAGVRWGQNVETSGRVFAGESGSALTGVSIVEPPTKRWEYVCTESGIFVTTPYLAGDKVFAVPAYLGFVKASDMFCFDRSTGLERWKFDNDGFFKEAISSPILYRNRILIGEGFHDDQNCKIYCIDPDTGVKKWEYKTTSQTEATPIGWKDRVLCGAGNQGFLCLSLDDGKLLWQFPEEGTKGRLLRFGAGAAVDHSAGKIFVGTGVDRNQPEDKGETALLCLNAQDGKLVWKTPMPLPIWSAPVLFAGRLYVGIGNGDIFTNAEKPAGGIYCLNPENGEIVWKTDLPNLVMSSPAIDGQQIFAGCRDEHVYALDRATGTIRWKTPMGSPVVSSPALAKCPGYDVTAHVFVTASGGKVSCLDPGTGTPLWTYDLSGQKAFLGGSPRVANLERTSDGDRRQIFFGAALGGITNGKAVFYCLEDLVKIK